MGCQAKGINKLPTGKHFQPLPLTIGTTPSLTEQKTFLEDLKRTLANILKTTKLV